MQGPDDISIVSAEHVYDNSVAMLIAVHEELGQIDVLVPKNSSKKEHSQNLDILREAGINVSDDFPAPHFKAPRRQLI